MNKVPTTITPEIQKVILGEIENAIAHQKAKSRSTGWTTADNVLASYTLWAVRPAPTASHGWTLKCMVGEPTSADFGMKVKKSGIRALLNHEECPPLALVERRDKGRINNPNLAVTFHTR